MADGEARELAGRFLEALGANDEGLYEQVLHEDCLLRAGYWYGSELQRARGRVVRRLMEEWAGWPDATVQSLGIVAEGERAAVQFRIQATEEGRYVEHNRAAFLTMQDGAVQTIDLYCPEPIPSAHRNHKVTNPDLSDEEVLRLFDEQRHMFDAFEWFPPNVGAFGSLREDWFGSGDSHPGSNSVGGTRWSAEEADNKIEQTLERYRASGTGFTWFVDPDATPTDLPRRLEEHGLVLAGEQSVMGRLGLDHVEDIPTHAEITIEVLDGTDMEALEATLQIVARCFNWTQEQVEERRAFMFERVTNPQFSKDQMTYLARLGGVPVANATLILKGSIAYLGGASTLPEYRGRKIYSTLLKRRLEDARERGFVLAAIDAEPMSKRVVERYGFKEYGKNLLYAWMPVIDMDVIRSLVPDE